MLSGDIPPINGREPRFLVGVIGVRELWSLLYHNNGASQKPFGIFSQAEEADYSFHRYKCRLPIFMTGDTEARARNIVFVNGHRVTIGDASFMLFLRLVVELFKNKQGTLSRRKLINGGYINANGEFQAISRLRQSFNAALDGMSSQELIETCENKCIRLSVHPTLIKYDKTKLLCHPNGKLRKLAHRLP